MHLDRFISDAATRLADGALILDAGAGDCRYKVHFAHADYESADFCMVDKSYAPVDYVCELSAIPVEDRRFDMVLLTQVLEHVPDPKAVLDELARVLRPGGTLCLTAPLYYQEHEQPYDFYRYTQFGLRQLLEQSGFAVRDLHWLEGYLGTLSHQLALASRELPRRPAAYGRGTSGYLACAFFTSLRPAFALLSRLLGGIDVRHRYTGGGHCKNYGVIAKRA